MPSRSTQTIDPAIRSRFFAKLPRELRNEIYRLAYAAERNGVVKLGIKHDMIQAEWRNRDPFPKSIMRQHLFIRPLKSSDHFTEPVMHQFLVNKQYYREAVEEYFREFALDHRYLSFPAEKSTAVRQNLRFLDIKWSQSHLCKSIRNRDLPFYGLREFVSLRKLQIGVFDTVFQSFRNRIPCLHTYNDADFDRISDIDILLKVPALDTIRLLPAASNLPRDQQERDTLAANFDALQKYIDRRLEKAKKTRIKKEKKAAAKKEKVVVELDEEGIPVDVFDNSGQFDNPTSSGLKAPSRAPSELDWKFTDPPGLESHNAFEESWMSAFSKKYGAFLDVFAIMGIILLVLCLLSIAVRLTLPVIRVAV
ncbi:hypothetical protein AC578_7489 [Pseudocercospora eumusae]|uniref:F-box domain-containing protein n=1 Tax=Pseudocercospora eumusae TaxID=321146 RepID=A0A139GWF2_9PEZI|nr:hypothetical protein AC578_7489 [Pseudocercospora eumusae]